MHSWPTSYHLDGCPWESSNRQEVDLDDDVTIHTDEHLGTKYLKDDQDPTFNVTESPMDDLSKDGVAEEPLDALEDDAASILTSAMQ
jgi:hypothetical protein